MKKCTRKGCKKPVPVSGHKFCSRDCYLIHIRTYNKVVKYCAYCKKEMVMSPSLAKRKRFCNLTCARLIHSTKIPDYTHCQNQDCGKKLDHFYKNKNGSLSFYKHKKYCNRKCASNTLWEIRRKTNSTSFAKKEPLQFTAIKKTTEDIDFGLGFAVSWEDD